jgi:hypothetical protein
MPPGAPKSDVFSIFARLYRKLFDFSYRRFRLLAKWTSLTSIYATKVAVNHRNTFEISFSGASCAPQISKMLKNGWYFFGIGHSQTSKYMRWTFQCHCTWYKTRVCTEVSFSREYCRGAWSCPQSENLLLGQERDVFKMVQTENYSTDGHHTAQSFCARRAYHRQKFGFEKSKMAKLRSIEFHTCGRISMRHAYPFVTIVGE